MWKMWKTPSHNSVSNNNQKKITIYLTPEIQQIDSWHLSRNAGPLGRREAFIRCFPFPRNEFFPSFSQLWGGRLSSVVLSHFGRFLEQSSHATIFVQVESSDQKKECVMDQRGQANAQRDCNPVFTTNQQSGLWSVISLEPCFLVWTRDNST